MIGLAETVETVKTANRTRKSLRILGNLTSSDSRTLVNRNGGATLLRPDDQGSRRRGNVRSSAQFHAMDWS